jgi:hypothetical protein
MEVMNNAYKNDRMHVHEVGMKIVSVDAYADVA